MSRSRKKYPITGFSVRESEKKDKHLAHKKMRSIEKRLMYRNNYEKLPIRIREVCSIFDFAKDGKVDWNKYIRIHHFTEEDKEELIKSAYRK